MSFFYLKNPQTFVTGFCSSVGSLTEFYLLIIIIFFFSQESSYSCLFFPDVRKICMESAGYATTWASHDEDVVWEAKIQKHAESFSRLGRLNKENAGTTCHESDCRQKQCMTTLPYRDQLPRMCGRGKGSFCIPSTLPQPTCYYSSGKNE